MGVKKYLVLFVSLESMSSIENPLDFILSEQTAFV